MPFIGNKPSAVPLTSADITDGIITSAKIADGTIVNADINASAAIAGTKISGSFGKVLQVVSATKTDTSSTSSITYSDVTGLSVSITPSSASNKILIIFNVYLSSVTNNSSGQLKLLRDSTAICIGDTASNRPRISAVAYPGDFTSFIQSALLVSSNNFLDSPNTTSATTYKIQFASSTSGTSMYINRSDSDRDTSTYDPRLASSITVMEIAA